MPDQAQDLEALKSELEQAKASAKEQEEKLLLIKDGGFYPDEVDTVLKLCPVSYTHLTLPTKA